MHSRKLQIITLQHSIRTLELLILKAQMDLLSQIFRDLLREHLKVSVTITKEEQLKSLYRQLAELNDKIAEREPGERFANVKEADTISKLANAIKKMETEVGLADITSVFSDLLKWLRTYDTEQAKQICPVLDAYVKSKLA